MKKLVIAILLVVVAIISASCSSGTTATVTPQQKFELAKIGARTGAVLLINSQCKSGVIAGIPCDVAIAQSGSIVNTLADDFRPGAVVDPADRIATRMAVSLELARVVHPNDFATDDAAAKARQLADITAARVLVDVVGDLLVSALGK